MLLKKTKWRSVGTVMAHCWTYAPTVRHFFYFILKSIFFGVKRLSTKSLIMHFKYQLNEIKMS